MRITLSAVVASFLAMAPIGAHHGASGFDPQRPIKLLGKISMVDWANPHVVIHLEVAGADGKTATWLVTSLPPTAMTRRGFSRSVFAAGTELSVAGHQALDGANQVNATSLGFTDGTTINTPDCFAPGQRCYGPIDRTDRGVK